MVAKISFGSSLYGALAYNGEKINKEEGKLLATNKIFDDCSGKTSIANALRDFQRYLSPHIRTEKPVKSNNVTKILQTKVLQKKLKYHIIKNENLGRFSF